MMITMMMQMIKMTSLTMMMMTMMRKMMTMMTFLRNLFPDGKLRNSVNGHGGVKIGEYHNSCSYLCSSSIPNCSSVVCLLSLKYQRGKRVEHIPSLHAVLVCLSRLFHDVLERQEKRLGRVSFERVNAKTFNLQLEE